MANRQEIDWQISRSRIYALLGQLTTRQPVRQDMEQLLREESIALIDAMFGDLSIGAMFRQSALRLSTGELSPDAVDLDFQALMRVPGPAYTHPFESCYRDRRGNNGNTKWGGFCGPYVRQTECYYQSEGLSPMYDTVDFADHIGAELSFMAHLCKQYGKALEDGNKEMALQLRQKQEAFAKEHLFQWTEDFCSELSAKAMTPFYQGVGQMLHAFIQMEKTIGVQQN